MDVSEGCARSVPAVCHVHVNTAPVQVKDKAVRRCHVVVLQRHWRLQRRQILPHTRSGMNRRQRRRLGAIGYTEHAQWRTLRVNTGGVGQRWLRVRLPGPAWWLLTLCTFPQMLLLVHGGSGLPQQAK